MAKATFTQETPATQSTGPKAVYNFEDLRKGDVVRLANSMGADVDRTTEIPAKPGKVVLELTEEEAQAVYAVLSNTTALDPVYDTYKALQNAGIGKGPFRAHGNSGLERD